MKPPSEVNVLGKRYSIVYVDNPLDVDPYKRKTLWGHLDYWTRTIRICDKELTAGDLWHTILHETLHAIAMELHLEKLKGDANDDIVDILALALADVLIRNKWLEPEKEEG